MRSHFCLCGSFLLAMVSVVVTRPLVHYITAMRVLSHTDSFRGHIRSWFVIVAQATVEGMLLLTSYRIHIDLCETAV